jgi:hypothetical protein
LAIREEGQYPSAARINMKLKRKENCLRGEECAMRWEIFKELGIDPWQPQLNLSVA